MSIRPVRLIFPISHKKIAGLLLPLCGAVLSFTFSLTAAEFYVAPNGSDANPGTRAKPFATFERARDKVREIKQTPAGEGGITIWIRGGDYLRKASFELSAIDSASSERPITWRAYNGETVRLLGGRKLIGLDAVTDAGVLARLGESARNHVRQISLHQLGIRDVGELKSRGFGRSHTPAPAELFFRGHPMTPARWPNEGAFEKIAGLPEGSARKDEHGGQLGKLEEGFLYSGDRPKNWKDTEQLWVHGYWAWDWANSYERVASLDTERHQIKTAPPHGLYGFRKGQRFYFLNVLEELDQPGEWFLDRNTMTVYLWPPESEIAQEKLRQSAGRPQPNTQRHAGEVVKPAEKFQPAEILLSLLAEPLIKLTDVSNVTFQGLILEATRGNAVEIHRGASNRIAGCNIRNIGDNGVTIDGGSGHGVLSCDIFDTGDGGVSLNGGDRRTLTPAGHLVENCHFQRQGRWSKCYVPAILMNGVGMRASHNLIHDHPHCAILFNGNDHLIEFNEIHHIALETGDVGAIYTGRDYTYRGNKIRNNFIHETGGVGMGSRGVYMDDCVSGAEISGNVFYKVQRAAFLGGGCDHHVINNIFVDCNHAVEVDGRGLETAPVWREMVNDTMRKNLAEVPLELYREKYPAMKNLERYYGPLHAPLEGEAFKGVPPDNNVVAFNVCVGKWLNVYWHAKVENLRLENNFTNKEPGFIRSPGNPVKATDFALKPESPAWKLGFQVIPLEKIGLYRNELRTRIE